MYMYIGLVGSDTVVSGSVVYGFQAPKRRGGLVQAGEFVFRYYLKVNDRGLWQIIMLL